MILATDQEIDAMREGADDVRRNLWWRAFGECQVTGESADVRDLDGNAIMTVDPTSPNP